MKLCPLLQKKQDNKRKTGRLRNLLHRAVRCCEVLPGDIEAKSLVQHDARRAFWLRLALTLFRIPESKHANSACESERVLYISQRETSFSLPTLPVFLLIETDKCKMTLVQ